MRTVALEKSLQYEALSYSDYEERASQVKLMWNIYTGASSTIAWLGKPHLLTDTNPQLVDLAEWQIWDVQEAILSQDLKFKYGLEEFSFDRFRTLLEWELPKPGPQQEGARKITYMLNMVAFMRKGYTKKFPIAQLAAWDRCKRATNPRDMLFGMCALASDSDDPLLSLHYSSEITEVDVFINLVEHSFTSDKSLNIICMATPLDGGWPSWLPNWTASGGRYIDLSHISLIDGFDPSALYRSSKEANWTTTSCYNASQSLDPHCSICRESLTLKVEGVYVDVITDVFIRPDSWIQNDYERSSCLDLTENRLFTTLWKKRIRNSNLADFFQHDRTPAKENLHDSKMHKDIYSLQRMIRIMNDVFEYTKYHLYEEREF
ncbi:hypothetical protein G7Y89_g15032 [Cudoniella acicularis]|uniref:Uncharacterized protein n=1 Tax=Cudoniella acicularis TaxID=354080 RepID=A0A8H4QWG9_9HELO|nr:hypothetical protein G7Y89_g15032 [Cudoniella acicularis]